MKLLVNGEEKDFPDGLSLEAVVEAERPDLMILDVMMPHKDGFEVLKILKESLEYSFIPVIMFTSSKNEEDIARSYKSGAASYIPKPVDYEEFVKIVDGFNYYWRVMNKLPRKDMYSK